MFEEDDELPDDEQEILVYVEFDGSVAGNTFSNENLHLDMIGLDSEHPIMQVNGKYYEGNFQDVVGTYMFFEKDKNPYVDDPIFDATPTLKYSAKARKILKMHRIFVEQKTEMLGDSNDPSCIPNPETVEKAGIPQQCQKAALQSWERLRNERMEGLNKYLEKQRIREEKRSQGIEPDSDTDEDNPFAIYKPSSTRHKKSKDPETGTHLPEAQKTTGSVSPQSEKHFESLTFAEPGPSTSKDTQLWNVPSASQQQFSDSDSDEAISTNLPNISNKHKATVKVVRKGKLRKTKKKLVKKGKRSQKLIDEEPHKAADESNEKFQVDSTEIHDTIESADDLPKTSSVPPPKNSDEVTRKLEKQRKREEKIRELSEKLKKAADEARSKNQQQIIDV